MKGDDYYKILTKNDYLLSLINNAEVLRGLLNQLYSSIYGYIPYNKSAEL